MKRRFPKYQKIVDYVLPLSKDESLSPRVQQEIDILLLLNKDDWRDSSQEFKLFQRWYKGDWKERGGVPWDTSE